MIMATNYILLIAAVIVLVQGIRKFRQLDAFPFNCRPGLKKDIGLMIVATIIYIFLEIQWIQQCYYEAVKPIDEYGWTVQEFLTKIIFLRMLWRVDEYRRSDQYKAKKEAEAYEELEQCD